MIESSYESHEIQEDDVVYIKNGFNQVRKPSVTKNIRLLEVNNKKNQELTSDLNKNVIENFQKIFSDKKLVKKSEKIIYLEPKKIRHQDRITDLFKILFSGKIL